MGHRDGWQPPIKVEVERVLPREARRRRWRLLLRVAALLVVTVVVVLGPRRSWLLLRQCDPRDLPARVVLRAVSLQRTPDLAEVSELAGPEFPPGTSLRGARSLVWLDSDLIAKVRMPRDALSAFLANAPAVAVTESEWLCSFKRNDFDPVWWDPEYEAPLDIWRVRRPEPRGTWGFDETCLAVPRNERRYVNVYVVWSGD